VDSGGLACTLESLTTTKSRDGFGKDAPVIGTDSGGVNYVACAPGTVVDDLSAAAGVGVSSDSDANDLLAPGSDGGNAMANNSAIDLLAGGGHSRREDEGNDGQETVRGVVLDVGAGVVLESDASDSILTSVGAGATRRGTHDSILLHTHGGATTGDVEIVLLADGGFAWPVTGALGTHGLGIVADAVGGNASNRGMDDVLCSGARGALGGSSAIGGGEGCGLRVRCSACTSDWIKTVSIKSTLLSLVGPISIGPPTSPSLGPSSPGARPAGSGSNLVVHGDDSLRPWGGGDSKIRSGEDGVLDVDGSNSEGDVRDADDPGSGGRGLGADCTSPREHDSGSGGGGACGKGNLSVSARASSRGWMGVEPRASVPTDRSCTAAAGSAHPPVTPWRR
jgi:hypothetical protein